MEQAFDVLIVDDEKGMREGCRRILSRHARIAETAETGEEAIAKAEVEHFDLALVDIKLPGISGLDLLTELRQIDPDLVTIVITGYATLELAIEATKRGAYDFLPKPFTPDELMGKVWNALDRRRLSVETKRLREEREKRLLELATEKSRLRTVINCIQDGVVVTNRDGEIVLYNPASVRLLALQEAGLLQQTFEASLPYPVLVELFREVLYTASNFEMLAREVSVDADGRVLMANVAPVRDESGERIGAVAVLRDITDMKALDRAKSQFVSMVSHELRAPLAAIEGYLSLVIGGLVDDDPEEQRLMLSRSRARAVELLNLIDDLSDISRLEAGRVARQIEVLNLADVVREVLVLLRPQATGKGVSLHDDLPADLPVETDREDMLRVFTNLIANAIKYNHADGEVWLRGVRTGEHAVVDVVDNGIGIPATALSRVFDEFYRVKQKETRGIAGTGLGLYIAKRIVESYHGTVGVASEVGAGSTFTVSVPIANPRQDSRATDQGLASPNREN
ncbi:MAG: sensor histidine kinase [Chloroflexota bacterium]